jgi:hypothetical protein
MPLLNTFYLPISNQFCFPILHQKEKNYVLCYYIYIHICLPTYRLNTLRGQLVKEKQTIFYFRSLGHQWPLLVSACL